MLSLWYVSLCLTLFLGLFIVILKKENNQSSAKFGSDLISNLAANLKPRYHFSATQNFFYERLPYHNARIYGQEIHSSRFIATAKVNKKNKPKVSCFNSFKLNLLALFL